MEFVLSSILKNNIHFLVFKMLYFETSKPKIFSCFFCKENKIVYTFLKVYLEKSIYNIFGVNLINQFI